MTCPTQADSYFRKHPKLALGATLSPIYHAKTARLLKDIKAIDERYAANPNPSLYIERLKLKSEFDLISTTKVNTLLLKSRHRFYELGDKAGKLLANQARAEATSRQIQEIKSTTGEIFNDPKAINNIFAELYTSLYTSEHLCSPNSTLDKIEFPQIPADKAEILGAPITTTEVQEAIKSLQSCKSP